MGITTNTLNYIIPAELQLLLYIFRYQIFTISQKLRFSTDFPYQTIQNLVADKNRLSSDEIYWLESFNYERAFRRHQILHSSNNILVLQFAVGRNLIRSSPDFTEEKIDNWPRVLRCCGMTQIKKKSSYKKPKSFRTCLYLHNVGELH